MILRCVTGCYLVYLAVPMVLLLTGSFGELWLNTLLPTGLTLRWYRDVAADPSFRRAFLSSLAVAAITCMSCAAIGLPLAYRRAPGTVGRAPRDLRSAGGRLRRQLRRPCQPARRPGHRCAMRRDADWALGDAAPWL